MNAVAKRKPSKAWLKFGEDLEAERRVRGLTQAQAAELVGVTQRSWASFEAGHPPSKPVAILLRQFLANKI